MLGEMLDTSVEKRARYYELLRAMTPAQRGRAAVAASRRSRAMAEAGLRLEHPDATADEMKVRLAVRLYGRPTAERVFGNVPDDAR